MGGGESLVDAGGGNLELSRNFFRAPDSNWDATPT
jgi:hypothetical protein